jgi:hypothetical protein
MSDRLITTTSAEGLQTLGSAAQRSFELITSTLEARIGEETALLFAEPVVTAQGAAVEWYTARPGVPVRLADLAEGEAAALQQEMEAQMARILGLAEELAAQKTEHGFWLAEALRNATVLPDAAALWAMRMADGALVPVVVNWGRQPDERVRVRGVLTAVAAKPVRPALASAAVGAGTGAAMAAPEQAEQGVRLLAGSGLLAWLLGLGWLILSLMIAGILWLMIAPCGLLPVSLRNCADPQAMVLPTDDLQAEIVQLEARLADEDRACLAARPRAELAVPPAEAPFEVPALAPVDPEELDRRLAERGAEGLGGEMTVSLVWGSLDDLDLRVQCPSGEVVNFQNPGVTGNGSCEGVIDVDANFPYIAAAEDPVENISFSRAEPGRYVVSVRFAADRAPKGRQSFALFVQRNGQVVEALSGEGTVREGTVWSKEIELTK